MQNTIWRPRRIRLAAASLVLLLVPAAYGINPASWSLSLSTTGNDVSWVSPTAVDPGMPRYDWTYEITRLEVFYTLFSIPGSLDATDDLGDDAMGSGSSGALPIVFFDDRFEYEGSGADARVEIDAQGFGRGSLTNVSLGSVPVGPVMADIERIEADATIMVTGIPAPAGDYDNNGIVEPADYELWQQNFGATGEQPADGNGDNFVSAPDYVVWRDNVGASVLPPAESSYSPVANRAANAVVPEPAAGWLLLSVGLFYLQARSPFRPARAARRTSAAGSTPSEN